MASDQTYLDYVMEQLSGLGDISSRAMMGEYIIYYCGKIVGGIYDNRFLVKPTAKAKAIMPDAPHEIPYKGAKEMLLVEELDDRAFLEQLLTEIADELPEPKKQKRKDR